jgi:hypothetical protein
MPGPGEETNGEAGGNMGMCWWVVERRGRLEGPAIGVSGGSDMFNWCDAWGGAADVASFAYPA